MYYYDIIKSSKVEVVAEVLEITVCSDLVFENCKRFNLVVCQCIPNAGLGLPVKVVSGTNKIDLVDRIGNLVIGAQIKTRCRYSLIYGDNPSHLYSLIPPKCCNE